MKKIRLNPEFVNLLAGEDRGSCSELPRYWRKVFQGLDYEIIADGEHPQLIFVRGDVRKRTNAQARRYDRCAKVFFTEESVWPHPGRWDYSFSCAPPSASNFHLICAAVYSGFEEILHGDFDPKTLERRHTPKTRFCNFVYSQQHLHSSWRVYLYEELSKYKPVDSPGGVCNNMPAIPWGVLTPTDCSTADTGRSGSAVDAMERKQDFLQHYKFTIVAEGFSKRGYVTEKLLHPLSVGSVPIYWGGAAGVSDYFNPDSFINCQDFQDLHAAIEYVKKVDNDEALYRSYLEAPAVLPGSLCHRMGIESVRKRVRELCDEATQKRPAPVSRKFINRFMRLPLDVVWIDVRNFFNRQFTHRIRWRFRKPPKWR